MKNRMVFFLTGFLFLFATLSVEVAFSADSSKGSKNARIVAKPMSIRPPTPTAASEHPNANLILQVPVRLSNLPVSWNKVYVNCGVRRDGETGFASTTSSSSLLTADGELNGTFNVVFDRLYERSRGQFNYYSCSLAVRDGSNRTVGIGERLVLPDAEAFIPVVDGEIPSHERWGTY